MLKYIILGWRRGIVLFATFLLLVGTTTTLTSCKKENNKIGSGALNPTDILLSGAVDTFTLKTYTVDDPNVYSSAARYALLGSINDEEIGVTDCGFYTQFRLSGLNPNFGDVSTITVDSFVLALEYIGSYGSVGNQTIEIFEVDEKMYADSVYKTTQDLTLKTQNWVHGSGEYKFDPNHLTIVGSDTLAKSQLRIKLDPAIAKRIMEDRYTNSADFGSNINFTANYLKGIYVKTNGATPASNKGMVAYFDLLDTDSKLTIYYKQDGVSQPSFDFVFNSETVDYNRFRINSTGKRIEQVVADSTLGNIEYYVQAGRYRGKIDFASVKNLPSNVVVHNAKLYLPIQQHPNSKFTAPLKIYLTSDGSTALEGNYDSYLKGYVVELRDYIQKIKSGAITSTTLTINTSSFVAGAERIILNGQQTTNKMKPTLMITYTEF